MEVFVNSYTEGVSFILECLQVLIFFFFGIRFLCACACACVRGCVRVLVCVPGTHGCIFMYKQELESGSVAWVLMNAFFACGFKKVLMYLSFPETYRLVSPSPSPFLLFSPLSPLSLSPLSPVVFADPDVFGTTLKFLLKKNTKKKTLKITKKNHPPENICWKEKKYVSKKNNP